MTVRTVPSGLLSGPAVCVALLGLLVALALAGFGIGRYPVGPGLLGEYVWSQLTFAGWHGDPAVEHVIMAIRLPRVAAAVIIGAALSVAGVAYQGLLGNPLVSPDILGASTGAGFGASLAIILGLSIGGLHFLAFTGGLIAVVLAWWIGRMMRRDPILGLVLAGIVIGALFSAGTSFLKYVADPDKELPAITFWLMGGLNGVGLRDVIIVAIPISVSMAVLVALRWQLNVITFGDQTATSLGVDVRVIRVLVIAAATLLTSASVTIGGLIAWVGLVVPHLARLLIGPDHRVLIPASALGGACFVLLVDSLARTVLTMEVPLGILTALVGAPFLAILLTRDRRW